MKMCTCIFRDSLGGVFRWLSGPLRGQVVICDQPHGHGGDHQSGDMYRWS